MKDSLFVTLLRGINVGGKHKVPMVQLRKSFETMGFSNVQTLLNSGNVIFQGPPGDTVLMEKTIAANLEKEFGFPIPVLIREKEKIQQILDADPFHNITITPDTRLYVSFIMEKPIPSPVYPLVSPDGSYRIIGENDMAVFSVLDVSQIKTTDGMLILEKVFGKSITTRNWNTVVKIGEKMNLKS